MTNKPKLYSSIFNFRMKSICVVFVVFFFGLSIVKASTHSISIISDNQDFKLEDKDIPQANCTIPIDVIFSGYKEDYIDISRMNNELSTIVYYQGIDSVWNEDIQDYVSILDLEITLNFTFHFTSESYDTSLNSFIDTNSWDSNTSALNISQLNIQESTGIRKSIFYDQEGKAIDGEAVEQYLDDNRGYVSDEPSYAIYFLNQSRFDSSDHSFEHWFEIDEIDPDSNETADWWRLEWDNELNPDVEFPYPSWGYQNRLYFIDPYSHQWYTKWTNTWWNPDYAEGEINYLTVDLDTYLEGYTPGTADFKNRLNDYLIDYLDDIAPDVGGRGDGLLYNEKEVSSQILFINDEASHGYSKEDLDWIFEKKRIEESFEYVVPKEVANITVEDTWVELSEEASLNQIIDDYTLGADVLGSYSWYRTDWTYLDGMSIFYAFKSIADTYFDMDKGDTTFTSWILLLQNVSMVAYAYGELREFTGLGGGGNVVCYKDLNRYFSSDGEDPRSGVTTLLVHELGHVLGFGHAEITNDADEGPGGYMREVMSYYTIGSAEFSVFLKDSLYRTSSFVAYYHNKTAIDAYRLEKYHNTTIVELIDQIYEEGFFALNEMEYVEAFLLFRQLYDIVDNQLVLTKKSPLFSSIPMMLLIPTVVFCIILINRKRKS